MIHQEKEIGRKKAFFMIALLFFLLLLPGILLPEGNDLRRFEALRALEVRELSSFPPMLTVFGRPPSGVYCFPLYPLAAKGLHACGMPADLAIRVVPLLSLAAMTLLVFFCCSTVAGASAGAAGACVMFTTFLAADKSFEGTQVYLQTLGIFSAWLLWFYFGIRRNSWRLAWITAGVVAGLVFYASGPWGLFLLIVPPLFLRRPLSVWTKPRGTPFFAACVIIAAFVLFWGLPRWHAGITGAFHDVYGEADFAGYLLQIVSFPFNAFVHLLPWSILILAPFCAALIPLNTSPILSKYMRVLWAGTFCLLWISPAVRSRDMIVLIPLAAVLIGLDYGIIVRRYGTKLLLLARFSALVLLILAGGLLFCRCMPESVKNIPHLSAPVFFTGKLLMEKTASFLLPALSALLALAVVIFARKNAAVWLMFAWVFFSFYFLFSSIQMAGFSHEARVSGKALLASLPEKERGAPEKVIVYKTVLQPDCYAECFHAGFKVVSLPGEESLPADPEKVYMLSQELPAVPARNWKKITQQKNRSGTLTLWEGTLRMDDDNDDRP